MERSYCTQCDRKTVTVVDFAQGDTICTNCGLVLEDHYIDESSEWRTFQNDGGDNRDPARVGGPSNPLLDHATLSTVISTAGARPKNNALPSSVPAAALRESQPDRSLVVAFNTIADMCDRLGLVATVKSRACEIYKKVDDAKPVRESRRSINANVAACLFIACRQENMPRTLKEISSVANGVTGREIGRTSDFIVRNKLEQDTEVSMGPVNAGDFIKRFCLSLAMSFEAVKAAQAAALNAQELDLRRSPVTISAAIIYIVAQLSSLSAAADNSNNKKKKRIISLKDISAVTGVAEGTIKKSCSELYPHASTLIPASFAAGEDLKKLWNPK